MEAIENFIEEIPPHLALKLATTVVTHPMEVCKVLMQVRINSGNQGEFDLTKK